MLPAGALQNRKKDGIAEYLNVRLYVDDDASPEEIAAASNVAVRLTFEIQSLDFPIGFPLSAYQNTDSSVAILIGSAAAKFVGNSNQEMGAGVDRNRHFLAIPSVHDAEHFARTLGTDMKITDGDVASESSLNKSFSLYSLFSSDGLLGENDGAGFSELLEATIVLGQNVGA